jgi:ATP-dependent exoDNAse (exonuclease V) beta subunit
LKTTVGDHGRGRYYVVDENLGIKLPSVTTVLTETSDKSALDAWIKRVGEAEAEKISKFSANRGTFMHSLHEHYLRARFEENLESPLQIAFQRAMKECSDLSKEEMEVGKNLFLNFHSNSDFYDNVKEIAFQEEPVWSFIGGGYAGRLDLMIKDKSDQYVLIDFKTSRKPKKEDWIEGYKKQVSAYSIATNEVKKIFPSRCEIWISCETGEVQKFVMELNDIKKWFGEFHKNLIQYHENFSNKEA